MHTKANFPFLAVDIIELRAIHLYCEQVTCGGSHTASIMWNQSHSVCCCIYDLTLSIVRKVGSDKNCLEVKGTSLVEQLN